MKSLNDGDHDRCNILTYPCQHCNQEFATGYLRAKHEKNCTGGFVEVRDSIKGRLKIFRLALHEKSADYEGAIRANASRVEDCLRQYTTGIFPSLNFSIFVHLTISQHTGSGERRHFIASGMQRITPGTSLSDITHVQCERLIEDIFKRSILQSGWVVRSIDYIDIYTSRYSPTGGSSFIQLPEVIRRKTSIVNPQNEDQKCFLWAVLAHLYPVSKNRHRPANYYQHMNKLDMKGIDYPVKPSDIHRIAKANNLRINVFSYDSVHGILPYLPSERNEGTEVDLLYIQEQDGGDIKTHYALITNRSGFFGDIEGGNRARKSYWCGRCIRSFVKEDSYMKHCENCRAFKSQKVKVPPKNQLSKKFDDYGKTVPTPCWLVCDFETIQKPDESGVLTSEKISTLTECVPVSFSYKLCSDYPDFDLDPVTVIVNENCGAEFIKHINGVYEKAKGLLTTINPMIPLTTEQECDFQLATTCHICNGQFDPSDSHPDRCKVRDHNHYPLRDGETSNYVGAAHNCCNRSRSRSSRLPVLFHNLTHFDLHLFFRELCADASKPEKIHIIKKSGENYIKVHTTQ